MRLAKYLAAAGHGSRRACEEIVRRGVVKVNAEVILDPAFGVDPEQDAVTVKNVPAMPREHVYYALHKPIGYTSSRGDKHAERLVTELVPADPPVWPVGRLDRDTSGLLIMTNDGALTQTLTHPSYAKEKEYLLTTDTRFTLDQLAEARAGVVLADGPLAPDRIEEAGGKTYRIVIHEGRKRVVRRFAAYFGKKTIKLVRVRIDGLELDDLPDGDYRILTPSEIAALAGDAPAGQAGRRDSD
jgi:23S rRNA pseudouridine2605 synthase